MTKLDLTITEQMDYETFVRIISDIPSCIFFKDSDLKYRFSSHCWAQLVSDDIIGKTDLEIRKDKENAQKAMEADRAIIESKKGVSYVIKSDIDGDVSYLELIKEPIVDASGQVIGIVGLINDVTEKTIMEKKIVDMSEMLEVQCRELETSNEELKASLKKVEQLHTAQKLFTASMNHELRSPLNGIIGSLQLLMDDNRLNSEQAEQVKNAYFSSQLMLEIVNELLDYAKLEMSNFTINNEPFSLPDIISNIQFVAKTQADVKGLKFRLVCDNNLQDNYIGDKTKISQIIHNLVSNAIKYTETGTVTLTFSYMDGNLIITCADTGQGISKESMGALFDPFVRFNEKKNANIQGTGLGLSVVKKILDLMKGQITVSSEINKGSVFTVKIPVESASGSCKSVNISSDSANLYTDISFIYDNLNVLCVDDSKVNATVLVSMLNRFGISTDVAYSAKEGIKQAAENKYNIIFLDHMMPGMDGLEAFEEIRKTCPLNKETPVIMLTGNSGKSYEELYIQHGIDGWLVKPIIKDLLIAKIKEVIR